MYQTRVIDSALQCSSLQDDWNALLAYSSNATVFNTFAWASCWLETYWRDDYALRIILIEAEGSLVALLPLYIQKSSNSCWFIGSGEPEAEEVASEYLDFIVHRDHAGSAVLATHINIELQALSHYRLILVNCCASSYAANLLRVHRRAFYKVTGAVYKLPIEDTFAATAKHFSKNQLKNARQCLNRFNVAPELEYLPFHSTEFETNWQALQQLHQKDWTARGKPGAFHSVRFSRFHCLMHEKFPEITQAFVALRLNDEWLAIHHFYVFGEHYCFYVAGTEKDRESRLSPGLMLHVLAMQQLSGTGAKYDFLKGGTNNSYKAKFCRAGDAFYTITVFEQSMRGSVRHALACLKDKWRAKRRANPPVNYQIR
jgi:CelD/BcsL family acetyltransferase involved in cellulose biosynthesis